jgi:hypothetical protein
LPFTAIPPSIFGRSPRTLPSAADAAGETAVTSKFYEPRDNLACIDNRQRRERVVIRLSDQENSEQTSGGIFGALLVKPSK